MRAIETFVPDPDFAIRKPSALIYEEVVRYGEVIRRGERLLADVRENGT
ncbi:hypothetical protein [Reyranella sp.]|nr:hypothetical protein [Reyranella sp.]